MSDQKLIRKEIEGKIKQVISESIGLDSNKIASDSRLREDLGLDSFAAIELIYGAEDKFGINITDEEAMKLVTINDLVELIQEKL